MLVSYQWLQEYFKNELPAPEKLALVLTLGAYEVEEVHTTPGGSITLDVDVLPNRAADSLSHRGIAREIGTLLEEPISIPSFSPVTHLDESSLTVLVEEASGCDRYIGCRVTGVQIGPSPDWLVAKLEALGQRSINNVVDITNYIMLEMGQPMHAFDDAKVAGGITVRLAKENEGITTLDDQEVILTEDDLVIADDNNVLAIAGIKGGKAAEVSGGTSDIILEAAHFSPVATRKTSRRIGIFTDSSKRFDNNISPELAAEAMERACALIEEYASGPKTTFEEVIDVYIDPSKPYVVGVSVREAGGLLGITMDEALLSDALRRLGFSFEIVTDLRTNIIERALSVEGKPYRLGASVSRHAPDEFDCSSLVAWAYAQAGIRLPRMTVDQLVYGEEIQQTDLLPGDLIFSNTKDGKIWNETQEWMPGTPVVEGVDHVGIFLGKGRVLHATRHHQGGAVVIEDLSTSSQFKTIVSYRRMPGMDDPRFRIEVPDYRRDLHIPEDIIEEIGRIVGYDNIPDLAFPESKPRIHHKEYFYTEKVKNTLTAEGFSEVQTYVFRDKGDVRLANPIASDKTTLRSTLLDGLEDALALNTPLIDLLGLDEIRLMEVGHVFTRSGERTMLGVGLRFPRVKKTKAHEEKELDAISALLQSTLGLEFEWIIRKLDAGGLVAEANLPSAVAKAPQIKDVKLETDLITKESITRFELISAYPFVVRDIAVFMPSKEDPQILRMLLEEKSGPLLVRPPRLFDVYEKRDTKQTSYAFRLVFQSHERTLTDAEVNAIMDEIGRDIEGRDGWEVR